MTAAEEDLMESGTCHMDLFAALRFTEDENLSGRIYWYIAPFPVKEGERVLAPVGPHDKLQCARVERTDRFKEEEAPYPPILCKHILARLGEREVQAGVYDLGGVRYDDRHFTRFRRILIAENGTCGAGLPVRAVDVGGEWLTAAAEEKRCVLLFGGNVREAAGLILRIVRGEDAEDVPPSILAALREKLH